MPAPTPTVGWFQYMWSLTWVLDTALTSTPIRKDFFICYEESYEVGKSSEVLYFSEAWVKILSFSAIVKAELLCIFFLDK